MKKSDKEIVLKIQKYCLDIKKLIAGSTQQDFKMRSSYEKQYACSFCLFQIGELAHKLSAEFKTNYQDFNWKGAYGLRNVIGHDYDGISVHSVWASCILVTQKLIPYAEKILEEGNN